MVIKYALVFELHQSHRVIWYSRASRSHN